MDTRTKAMLIASKSYAISEILKRSNLMFFMSIPNVDRKLWGFSKGSHSDSEVRAMAQLVADLELEDVVERLDKEVREESIHSLGLEDSSLDKLRASKSFRRDVNLRMALSSYTLLYKDGRVLSLPNNPSEARSFMEDIRGKHLEVYTGYSLIELGTLERIKEVIVSAIKIRDMSDALIEHYLATGEVYLEASCMFFNKGSNLLEASMGDANNLYGMSLSFLVGAMRRLGYEPNQFWKV